MERENLILSLPRLKLLCTGLAVASMVTAVWGVVEAWSTWHFIGSAARAKAMVVGTYPVNSFFRDEHDNPRTVYYPMISFRTASGEQVEVNTALEGRYPGKLPNVFEVEVLYSMTNPRHMRVNNFRSLWGWTMVIFASSLGCGLAGGSLAWYFSDPRHLSYTD